jgi:hypothetical protein
MQFFAEINGNSLGTYDNPVPIWEKIKNRRSSNGTTYNLAVKENLDDPERINLVALWHKSVKHLSGMIGEAPTSNRNRIWQRYMKRVVDSEHDEADVDVNLIINNYLGQNDIWLQWDQQNDAWCIPYAYSTPDQAMAVYLRLVNSIEWVKRYTGGTRLSGNSHISKRNFDAITLKIENPIVVKRRF